MPDLTKLMNVDIGDISKVMGSDINNISKIMGLTVSVGFVPAGSPIAWWSADTITGLENGDPVGTWPNALNPGTYDFTQGIVASKPTYVASSPALNNLPAISFDYVDDWMNALDLVSAAANYSYFFVINPTLGVSIGHVLFETADGSSKRTGMWNGGGASNIFLIDGNVTRGTQNGISGPQILVGRLISPASSDIYRNGALVEGGLSYTQYGIANEASYHPRIGVLSYGSGQLYQGEIAEFILYNSGLSDTDREANETGLNAKYAIY